MRVIISKPHDVVTLRNKRGTPRAMVSYRPDPKPQTVKREHGEEMVSAGKAREVDPPKKADTDD